MANRFYYPLAHLQETALAADFLSAEDPYALRPTEIVERLLAGGCKPDVELMQRVPFLQTGSRSEVTLNGQLFMVAVSRQDKLITVQQVCAAAYPDV